MKALKEILAAREELGEIVEVEEGCPDCRGRGWKVEGDGGAGAAVRCDCANRRGPERVKAAMIAAGMQRAEIRSAFEPWEDWHQPKPVFARDWLGWVLRGAEPAEAPTTVLVGGKLPREPWILTLFGKSETGANTGLGKTKTAAVLARIYLGGGGGRLVWANATDAFDRVQQERKAEGFSEYENRLKAAGLLVIDDYGRNHRQAEKLDLTVDEWLYQRHRAELPTVLPTNLEKPSQIKDPRIQSRIAAGLCRTLRAATDFRDSRR